MKACCSAICRRQQPAQEATRVDDPPVILDANVRLENVVAAEIIPGRPPEASPARSSGPVNVAETRDVQDPTDNVQDPSDRPAVPTPLVVVQKNKPSTTPAVVAPPAGSSSDASQPHAFEDNGAQDSDEFRREHWWKVWMRAKPHPPFGVDEAPDDLSPVHLRILREMYPDSPEDWLVHASQCFTLEIALDFLVACIDQGSRVEPQHVAAVADSRSKFVRRPEAPGICSKHKFTKFSVAERTWCQHEPCKAFLWGLWSQGSSCTACSMIVCHDCSVLLDGKSCKASKSHNL